MFSVVSYEVLLSTDYTTRQHTFAFVHGDREHNKIIFHIGGVYFQMRVSTTKMGY